MAVFEFSSRFKLYKHSVCQTDTVNLEKPHRMIHFPVVARLRMDSQCMFYMWLKNIFKVSNDEYEQSRDESRYQTYHPLWERRR